MRDFLRIGQVPPITSPMDTVRDRPAPPERAASGRVASVGSGVAFVAWFVGSICTLLMLCVLGAVLLAGWSPRTVPGEGWGSGHRVGDLVLLAPAGPDDLRAGAVISYRPLDHEEHIGRISAIDEDGDLRLAASPGSDLLVTISAAEVTGVGRMVVPFVGALWTSHTAIPLALAIVLVIVVPTQTRRHRGPRTHPENGP